MVFHTQCEQDESKLHSGLGACCGRSLSQDTLLILCYEAFRAPFMVDPPVHLSHLQRCLSSEPP